MGETFKTIFYCVFLGALGALAIISSTYNAVYINNPPTVTEIQGFDNNSGVLLIKKQRKVIKKSRESAVQVISASPEQHVASQSGTYVTFLGRHFILTTNHGIIGNCSYTKIYISHTDEFVNCGRFIELNGDVDYALIEIQPLSNRHPINIPEELPRDRRQWERALSVMNKIFYTGYPNSTGPLTISGETAGYSDEDYLYAISYAWSGSSGAGVFSQQGDYIGYVLAVDVGDSLVGHSAVLENVVIIVPAFKINWETVIGFPPLEMPKVDNEAN
jgi:hypothetical protein